MISGNSNATWSFRAYCDAVVERIHNRALLAIAASLGRSPGCDVIAWMDAVTSEAEMTYGVDWLVAEHDPARVQLERALVAEWLTTELTAGPRRPNGLRHAFKHRFPESDREDWAFVLDMAKALGFAEGEFWRLPEDHPWNHEDHRLFSDDLCEATL